MEMKDIVDTIISNKIVPFIWGIADEYETDTDLRDTEQMPLLEEGGIEAFIRREVLPYTSDTWIKADATKVGFEVSFTRHFYKSQPLRTPDDIRADKPANRSVIKTVPIYRRFLA